MIKIEHNIPVPPSRRLKHKYPFYEMKVGDSFLIDHEVDATSVRASAYYHSKNGRKYTIRKIDGRLRCWRIK